MGTGFKHMQIKKEELLAELLGLMCALSAFGLDHKAQNDIEDIFEELQEKLKECE